MAGRGGVQQRRPAAPWRCKNASICCLALALEDRAGGVEQPAAGLEQRPQRVQQLAPAARASARHVGGAAQPADVGVAAHDARGAAGRVEQDGVEGPAVPPGGRLARRRRPSARPAAAGAAACRARAPGAARRCPAPAGPGRPVPADARSCRPARRRRRARARPAASAGLASSSSAARCADGVLHRHLAFGKAGQLAPPGRAAASTTAWPPKAGSSSSCACAPLRGQPLHIVGAAAAAAVDAQRHRRVLVGGRQQRLPVLRPVALQPLDPPQRVVPGAPPATAAPASTSASRSRRKRRSTALTKAAAAGVRRRAAATAWSTSVCVGVGRPLARGHSSASATHSKRLHPRRRRLRRQRARSACARAELAQCMEWQRLHTGPQLGVGTRASASVSERPARTACTVSALRSSRCDKRRAERRSSLTAAV